MHAVGVQPVLGRLFTAEEDRQGGPVNKALLGYGLWQGRYGGAPDALGKMILLPMGEFEAMRIPLTAGRFFERTDSSDNAPVVIVNEVGARALFGERNPIGQMVQWGDTVGPANPYCRVVGVVGDVKQEGAERDAIELYYPFTQWPVGGGYYVLRTHLDQTAASRAIRAAILKEDQNAAIVSIRSMTERIDGALWSAPAVGRVVLGVCGVGAVAGRRRVVRIAELLRFGARAGHRDPVGARGNTSGRAGHGRSTRNGAGPARTRDRVVVLGGSSPNDRSLVGRCCHARLGHLRVGGRLPGSSRPLGVAMAGRSRFAARPRAVTEERIDEAAETNPKTRNETGISRCSADALGTLFGFRERQHDCTLKPFNMSRLPEHPPRALLRNATDVFVVKPRVAPRAAGRPRGKARRRSILAIFDRGATPSTRDAAPFECSGAFSTDC